MFVRAPLEETFTRHLARLAFCEQTREGFTSCISIVMAWGYEKAPALRQQPEAMTET